MRHLKLFAPLLLIACTHAEIRTTLPPPEQCRPISICTYNFGAITPRTEPENYLPVYRYIVDWPGIIIDERIRDHGGAGQVVVGFQTKESGAGIWWYWMLRRAGGSGYNPNGTTTFQQIAMHYAGIDDVTHSAVQIYVRQYQALSAKYFGYRVDADEPLDLGDADIVWNLARTMFNHESGLTIVDEHLTRAQFDKGIELANAFIIDRNVDHRDFIAD